MAAGLWATRFSRLPANVRAVASPAERDRLVASWTTGFVRLWRGAGLAAAILAVLGVFVTVMRRVRPRKPPRSPSIAPSEPPGAGSFAVTWPSAGGIGAVGAGLGCWAALFVVSAVVPEGRASAISR
jgi:hypothetical protein